MNEPQQPRKPPPANKKSKLQLFGRVKAAELFSLEPYWAGYDGQIRPSGGAKDGSNT